MTNLHIRRIGVGRVSDYAPSPTRRRPPLSIGGGPTRAKLDCHVLRKPNTRPHQPDQYHSARWPLMRSAPGALMSHSRHHTRPNATRCGADRPPQRAISLAKSGSMSMRPTCGDNCPPETENPCRSRESPWRYRWDLKQVPTAALDHNSSAQLEVMLRESNETVLDLLRLWPFCDHRAIGDAADSNGSLTRAGREFRSSSHRGSPTGYGCLESAADASCAQDCERRGLVR